MLLLLLLLETGPFVVRDACEGSPRRRQRCEYEETLISACLGGRD